MSHTATTPVYELKEIENERWGIYLQDRLLATVGSYEACTSMLKSLDRSISYADTVKASTAYKKAINRSLIIS